MSSYRLPDSLRKNKLIVITGPTASGKTGAAISVAKALGTEIISADSRQIFRDLPIGTAAPAPEELAEVPHHFIGTHSLEEYFSAAEFETQAVKLIENLSPVSVLAGGSVMYIDAVCNGIDEIPTISEENRAKAIAIWKSGGLQKLRLELLELDPVYYRQVDLNNHKRLVHALEIIYQSGRPYSSLRTGIRKERNFDILKYALDLPREELFRRINLRAEKMIRQGFIEEARKVYPFRHLNALNTVGYKELFSFFDGEMSLDEAVARIQKNTRVYAKKQLTWLKRDPSVRWISPENAADTILRDFTNSL